MAFCPKTKFQIRFHWHLYWTKVEAGVNMVRSWINKTVMYCFMHCLAFLLRQLKCMTRADAMRGSWWWIFDIIFSLKLMWDSQNDFIIIISGHVHVPFLGSQREIVRKWNCRVLEEKKSFPVIENWGSSSAHDFNYNFDFAYYIIF